MTGESKRFGSTWTGSSTKKPKPSPDLRWRALVRVRLLVRCPWVSPREKSHNSGDYRKDASPHKEHSCGSTPAVNRVRWKNKWIFVGWFGFRKLTRTSQTRGKSMYREDHIIGVERRKKISRTCLRPNYFIGDEARAHRRTQDTI